MLAGNSARSLGVTLHCTFVNLQRPPPLEPPRGRGHCFHPHHSGCRCLQLAPHPAGTAAETLPLLRQAPSLPPRPLQLSSLRTWSS